MVRPVQRLSDHVANQIAAGEVVERPASVVKELVENALDAGATKVEVETQAGGRSLIRVSDNGHGMTPPNAQLALERHATSKISDVSDLPRLQSMGFRGEALPSIASVTEFALTTRHESHESAIRIVVRGGKLDEPSEAGRDIGTTIEARNLFYNVPARRKFMRKIETEKAHIQSVLLLFSLARPDVGFKLIQDQRVQIQLTAEACGGSGAEQLRALKRRLIKTPGLGGLSVALDFETQMETVDHLEGAEERRGIRIWGYIGQPGDTRSTRQDQTFFVNQRPVENVALRRGLEEGYGDSLAKGRFPRCVLFLETSPEEIDVNIHPAKREIKFFRERAVQSAVLEATAQALSDYSQSAAPVPRAAKAEAPRPDLSRLTNERQAGLRYESRESEPAAPPATPAREPGDRPIDTSARSEEKPLRPAPPELAPERPKDEIDSAERPNPAPLLRVEFRLLGGLGGEYAVFETDRGMAMLNVRAAQERTLYERALETAQVGEVPSQKLLLPETIELAPRDIAYIKTQFDALRKLGIGLSEFGPRTLLLDSLPSDASGCEPRAFVVDVIDELRETLRSKSGAQNTFQLIARAICGKTAERSPPASNEQIEALLARLKRCKMPYTCPRGRPTIIEMGYSEIERRFRG